MAVTIKGFASDWSVPTGAKAKLDALYALKGEAGGPRHLTPEATPCESLARWMDFGTGSHRIAIAGDSTWNDGGDPPRKMLMWLQGKVAPNHYLREVPWNSTNSEYSAPTVIQAGSGTASTGGTVLTDNFNRTSTDLVGSTTSGGQTWTGNSGTWTSDGTLATGYSAVNAALSYDTGSKNPTVTAVANIISAADAANSPQLRVAAAAANAQLGTSLIWAQLSISTTGTPNLGVWKRINNTATQIVATDFSMGLAVNSATPQEITIALKVDIQNITVTTTIGSTVKTYTATITESDYAALGTYSGFLVANNINRPVRVNNVTMDTPAVAGESSGLEIMNAAVGGTTLAYQHERLATMYPAGTHIDTLLISGGHNHGTQTPEAFIAIVDAFVTDYRAAHPESRVLVASQNPQKAPAIVPSHARRQAALRAYAMEKGFEYLPIFEAFTNQPDGGASLIMADGVHPTVSTPTVGLGWSGATLQAAVWFQMVNSRRLVGTAPAITAVP